MRLNSTVRLTSDGTVQRVDLTYDVQDGDEVQVYFNDDEILTGWTLQRNTSPQRVDFDEKIPAGTLVLIRRYTDMRELPHFFHFTGNAKGGAEFNGQNLDENFDKILRAAQDAMDSFELIGINLEAASDARASADAAQASAAQAANSATQANQRANAAQSSATAAAGSATTANNHANRAEAAQDGVAASAAAAEAAAVRAEDSEAQALVYKDNADQARIAAQNSASAASASAVSAGNQASNAAASATAASGYSNTAGSHANAAAGSAAEALTHRNSAANSATAAAFSEDLAQKWATNPEDQAVEEGQYSAKHWALKAAQTVVGAEDVITKDTAEIKFTGTGRPLAPLEATIGSVNWSKVTGKPSTYVGDWNTLINKPTTYATTWSMVAGKPTTFPSSWSQVADKPALASAAHTHTWDDVYDKPSAFPTTWETVTGKPTVFPTNWSSVASKPTTFPPSTHTHSFNDLTGRPSVYPTNWSNVSGKPNLVEFPASYSGITSVLNITQFVSITGSAYTQPLKAPTVINRYLRVSVYIPMHYWTNSTLDRAIGCTLQYRRVGTSTWTNYSGSTYSTIWTQGDAIPKPCNFQATLTNLNNGWDYEFRLYVAADKGGEFTIHSYTMEIACV